MNPHADASLRPEHRLHTPADYAAVFSFRRAVRGSVFNLHYRPNALQHPRIGFVVAKKLARRAVMRNLIKRIVREAFRQRRTTLPQLDLVLRLAAPAHDAPRAELRIQIDSLLDRLPRNTA